MTRRELCPYQERGYYRAAAAVGLDPTLCSTVWAHVDGRGFVRLSGFTWRDGWGSWRSDDLEVSWDRDSGYVTIYGHEGIRGDYQGPRRLACPSAHPAAVLAVIAAAVGLVATWETVSA